MTSHVIRFLMDYKKKLRNFYVNDKNRYKTYYYNDHYAITNDGQSFSFTLKIQ